MTTLLHSRAHKVRIALGESFKLTAITNARVLGRQLPRLRHFEVRPQDHSLIPVASLSIYFSKAAINLCTGLIAPHPLNNAE
jgi:hypothetical protein